MAAYWVVRVNVLDVEKLRAYAPLAAAAVEAHGGRYLARGGAHETQGEGGSSPAPGRGVSEARYKNVPLNL